MNASQKNLMEELVKAGFVNVDEFFCVKTVERTVNGVKFQVFPSISGMNTISAEAGTRKISNRAMHMADVLDFMLTIFDNTEDGKIVI